MEISKNLMDSRMKEHLEILSNISRSQLNEGDVSTKGKFEELLMNTIDKVNTMQDTSNKKTESLIKGEDVSMHEVMLSAQEAQMSMQLLMEFRNKIYDAYQEMNKVQI